MKVIKFISVSVLLLLLLNFNLKSQIIGGKVVQIDDRKSIPYTTLAIEGTTLGIVSDFDGRPAIAAGLFGPGRLGSGHARQVGPDARPGPDRHRHQRLAHS